MTPLEKAGGYNEHAGVVLSGQYGSVRRLPSLTGFSIIGIVLAVGILGGILVTVESVLTSSTLVRSTQFGSVALGIAGSELDRMRSLGYDALPATGPVLNSDLTLLPQGSEDVTVTDFDTESKSVTVTVNWVEPRTGSQSLSLTTLVSNVGGLP